MAKKKSAPKTEKKVSMEKTTYLDIHKLLDNGFDTRLEYNVDGAILTLSKKNENSVDFFIPKLNKTIAHRFFCSCSEFDNLNRSTKKRAIKYITIKQQVFICK